MGALDVRCPSCGKPAGEPCVSVHAGRPCRKPHAQRETRAQVRVEGKRAAKRQRRRVRRIPESVKEAVVARSEGRCEACEAIPTLACSGWLQFHHVLRRSQGGQDTVENLAHVCSTHHAHIHAFPEHSYRVGLLRRATRSVR